MISKWWWTALLLNRGIENRLADSLELAMSQADGVVHVLTMKGAGDKDPNLVLYSEKAACVFYQISYPEFTPAAFSFNSPPGSLPNM